MKVCVQLARTREEHESALRLLGKSHKEIGFTPLPGAPADLWLTKHHALPSTNTVVALADGQVVGALTMFGESAFRLPLEERADLSFFRRDLAGRVAEFSYPGLSPAASQDPNVLLALYQFAICFGQSYCHYEAYITQVPKEWAARYQALLRYEPLLVRETLPGLALYRAAREGADFRSSFAPGFEAEFRYPERKFFLVAHPSLDPPTLHYLFNERSRLFENLSDLEIRVLKNYYDQADYAEALPKRALRLPFAKVPAYRRFPMSCEGHLCRGNGQRASLQMLDASREGMKVQCAERLVVGSTYPITLQVGVMKQAEVIATCVWSNEASGSAGFHVRSGDRNWERLIEYLECDFLRAVA